MGSVHQYGSNQCRSRSSFVGFLHVDMAVHQLQNHEHNQLPLYQTLKQCQGQRQIRLIFLDTGDHVAEDAPVTCGLSPWALNEVKTPRYIALSYVWGPPDTSQSIVVNGQSFKVSANLLNFLKSHRRRCTDNPELRKMPLWIDNVCINQADTKERSHQVSLMKSIYQNASMVISWLGPSFPFSDWTFGVLRSFKEQIDRTHIAVDSDLTSIQLKVTDASWLSLFPQACKSDPSLGTTLRSVVWDSIRELCEHIYWRRVWVFQ